MFEGQRKYSGLEEGDSGQVPRSQRTQGEVREWENGVWKQPFNIKYCGTDDKEEEKEEDTA